MLFLFEVSYTTIEFAFGKAETIQEVENRFNNYMNVIQRKLAESNHAIVGCGIHPNWDKNEEFSSCLSTLSDVDGLFEFE